MGAGAVTGGLVFGFLAEGRASESGSVGGQLAVEEAKDLADVMSYGLGGAGIATSLALWYFGDDAPSDLAFAHLYF